MGLLNNLIQGEAIRIPLVSESFIMSDGVLRGTEMD